MQTLEATPQDKPGTTKGRGWFRKYRDVHRAHPSKPQERQNPFPWQRKKAQEARERRGERKPAPRPSGRPRGHNLWGNGQRHTLDVLAGLSHGMRFYGVHPGDYRLATECNVSRATAHAHLRDLTELGLIELRVQGGGCTADGKGKANLYALTLLGWAVQQGKAVLLPHLLSKNTTAEESKVFDSKAIDTPLPPPSWEEQKETPPGWTSANTSAVVAPASPVIGPDKPQPSQPRVVRTTSKTTGPAPWDKLLALHGVVAVKQVATVKHEEAFTLDQVTNALNLVPENRGVHIWERCAARFGPKQANDNEEVGR